jgi:PAS domain S-box-containing protein
MGIESNEDRAQPAASQHLPERREAASPDASRQLVHELRVHQIELELQNEELRRTQAALDTARARYFDLYDLAPVGYCTVSATEDILEANLTAASMLGLACSDLVGCSVQKFILPQDQDIYYLHRKRLLDTGQPQSCILRMLRARGKPFWAQLSATFDPTAPQNAIHRLVLTDVDERKVAQDQIRISDVALKAVSQGVLITGPDLHVISANRSFTTMFGYSAAELRGIHCAQFNGPQTDADMLAAFQQAIDAQREFSGEFLNYRKNGSCFWNEVFMSPVLDEQGQLIHFISINTDITERKKLDQVLREKNLELQRATTMAEKANLAKSDFLSSMSHELRTPLNSILGFAQLLESGTPQPTAAQQQRIQMILRGGWYLLTLINEILDLASIESGKVSLALEPVSVASLLADCQGMIEPDVQRSGIQVDFPVVDDAAQVFADPIRLKQVIVNLLSNAIKYNRVNGTVAVTVCTETPQRLRISVHDTGQGLSEQMLSQLFVPFSRLGQETGHTEGTGIGLVVTRRLTELMGGSVGVHSVVGEGSVFWVELGTAPQTVASPGQQGPSETRLPGGPVDTTAYSVLYVEDNLANLDLVAQILADRPNLRLLRAHSGTQGLAMARSHKPRLILMDLDLPDISGLEVLGLLRQDASTRHIPVLAVSANAMPQDIVKGLAAGFFRYISKPFRIQEFLEVLDLALAVATDTASQPASQPQKPTK